MKKTVLTYGLISGAIVSIALLAGILLMSGPNGEANMEGGAVFGYTSMIVALSLIFFGTRSYRDKHLEGKIGFWKAFQIGILITAIASVMYVVTWMIYYHTSDMTGHFGQQYAEHIRETLKSSGATDAQIAAKMKENEDFMKLYESNPLVMFGATLMEIFPVGLVISLISSFFLRTKKNIAMV
ncbi:MAG: DUF4199 family protein [Bacteroidetes bacterium]|nr:DUF4199 family protein [Bacteroidota bacterium]